MRSQSTSGATNRSREYHEPKTFEEAERRSIELLCAIQVMEAQLGDPSVRERKGDNEYGGWRAATIKAKAYRLREYKKIKLWMKQQRDLLRERLMLIDGIEDPEDPYCILAGLHQMITDILQAYSVTVTDEQWRLLDQASALVFRRVNEENPI